MSERLENIKYGVMRLNQGVVKMASLSQNDFDWLIEQAERAEELGREGIFFEGAHYIEAENTRLREALKFYADDENYETKVVVNPGRNNHYREILCDEGNIARQALERESK